MYRDGYRVDILFLIEHRDRELDSVCAIAKILKSEYGLSVAIASLLFQALLSAVLVRPKIVVFPFGWKGSEFPLSLFRSIYGDKIIYVNMNWEEILSSVNKEYKRPKDEFAKSVLRHFCWGENFKDYLLNNGVKEENIFITGNPAASLLMKIIPQRNFLRNFIAKRFKLPLNYKWLFFPMNCGWAFTSDYHIRTRIKAGYNEQKARTYRQYVSTTLDTIINWIAGAEKEAKDNNLLIILRPHPSVSVKQYKERFLKAVGYVPDYVRIFKDLTAKEWLVSSDVCYTNFSSVALDAQLIGRPTYLMEPELYPYFIWLDWYDRFPRIKSSDEFRTSLTGKLSPGIESSPVLTQYIDINLDGIKEMARYLAKFARDRKTPTFFLRGFLKEIAGNPRQTMGGFLRMLAAISGINPFQVLKPGVKADFFQKKDVVRLLKN